MRFNKQLLAEMRGWIEEAGIVATADGLPDRAIVRTIQKEYVGGIEAFIRDGLSTPFGWGKLALE